ncbi:MAG: T9SS type A sorting domain-containing protein [Bacteroidales bacterium]|nr:T9SS type A sorting domain-containing protein [Bacteroidales bacterium]
MKKFTRNTFMGILFLMTTLVAFSQDKTQILLNDKNNTKTEYQCHKLSSKSLIFAEDFSGEEGLPVGWTIVGSGQNAWNIAASNSAGGIIPEVALTGYPSFTGNSKLVTPKISTSTYDKVILQFNHFLHNTGGVYSISVETTTNGVTWNEVWSANLTGSVNPETVFIPINNVDVGSDNFQVAFTFNGNSSQLISWNIDNIMINEDFINDAEATNIFVPTIAGDNFNIAPMGVVTNKGSEAASFDAIVEILDEASDVIYTKTITITNLPSFESKFLNFPSWNSTVGNYTVNLTTNLLDDENPDNNSVSSYMEILGDVIFKKPLYQEFTSSTCGPCGFQNPALDAVIAANPITHSLIKYQVNFPDGGDPYSIPECGLRASYYGIDNAPKLFINSTLKPVGFMSQTIYNSFLGLPAEMSIDISTAIIDPSNMIVTIEANINVIENFAAGLKAHIAIVEKTTHNNTSSNGETEFNNVLMKMLPNADGTTLEALSIGIPVSITQSYNMSTTHMEEFADLAVIVFVQDDSNKDILQSEMIDITVPTKNEANMLVENTVKIFPNPASGNINITSDLEIEQLIIFNLMGQIVYESTFYVNSMNVDISSLESGLYLFKIINAEGSIVKQIIVK